ncbi:hypothetical protein StoSoilB5_37570 [Arthrobacter sp. StoSoilB5]|nr:hypothetical protein StoSoilB5_37570 [Arthrobacter sp. StoSoilB5]
MQRQQASPDTGIVPILVFPYLLAFQVGSAVEFNNQAFIDQAIHLPYARQFHVHPHPESGADKMGMGEYLQERICPGEHQVKDCPEFPVPVPR